MAKLMFTGELPVFITGNHTKIVGRAIGYEERGQVVLQVILGKNAGLELVDVLAQRVALGLELHFSPVRERLDGVKQEEEQDGPGGTGG